MLLVRRIFDGPSPDDCGGYGTQQRGDLNGSSPDFTVADLIVLLKLITTDGARPQFPQGGATTPPLVILGLVDWARGSIRSPPVLFA